MLKYQLLHLVALHKPPKEYVIDELARALGHTVLRLPLYHCAVQFTVGSRKMASAKFLEEALSTDVDESAVTALVGTLENQLGTSTSAASNQSSAPAVINQNHVNSGLPNGGTVSSQKHGTIANGESVNVVTTADGAAAQVAAEAIQNTGTVATNFINQVQTTLGDNSKTQNVPNGTIGLTPLTTQTVLQTSNVQTIQAKQPTLVIKTSAAPGSAPGLVTVPMNVTATVPQVNNVGSPTTQSPNILPNLQVINVRPGVPAQPQKGQPARVVLSAPQLVGARQGAPSLHGLQPGQQGHLLLKTENGQYQLLRVGPAPAPANLVSTQTGSAQPLTLRMQTVPSTTTVATSNVPAVSAIQTSGTTSAIASTPVQKPANDNTKEKCRKFLANLLELSSREPKTVERSVRTLIQDLIDMRVEPEDFCDRLERLLNASPQPCLIGFLKKSLPLLRHSLATKELSIDGIRPPPANVVFSIASGTPTVQTQVRPGIAATQVRLVQPGTTVTRMVTTIRQPNATQPVIVSNSQPPALHPVFPNNQVRPGVNVARQPIVRTVTPGQIRQPVTIRTVPSAVSKIATKEKEKKSFSLAYTGDDDINDVAAMGGVNLVEETQRILGSTDYVGTQIRSCKEEYFLNMTNLQNRIRHIMTKHGLDEPNSDVAAAVSHAAQERVKNLIEKLAIITEHRLEMIKTDPRYEVSNDVKGQLKFLEDLDRAERKRHEELEREMLLKAAKSRSKSEDPEQAKLKAKAKEMQRVEMEELRQREANATALQAIGPRKKPRLDGEVTAGSSQIGSGTLSGSRSQLPLRQRMKKVTLRDLQFLFETEKDLCKSTLLYKSYLK
ncbi:Taf4 [Trypoxylus dichotomus]